ncbi:LuxR C-terminal-related transcriptional regulator [Ruania halotolerans]|uniref:LuxR C-terminal-related transcriptional regulator n=1 Tax=Ruania halotolerans TaxID=2897773 RepID=UPI001E48E5DD|nr:LuxR C-terminal-related transcriptional regulator [Ruania halotolerans]UFU07361.1 LuxR C-terminal-related transcriptional regulator [Ruania halotolerans]
MGDDGFATGPSGDHDPASAVAADAGAIVDAARAAWSAGDTERTVALIDEHWSILFEQGRHELDALFRLIPLSAFKAHPRAAAVRDIRLHTDADAVARMLGPRIAMPQADDLSTIDALARSEDALTILGVTSARMIAYRVRGHYTRAHELAAVVERLARIAGVHQPALVHARVPNALLQGGVSRGLAGDFDGALGTLREAYDRGPEARSPHVARDAAGKAALFSALAGDIDQARRWLRRYETAAEVDGWLRSRLDLSADLAQSLVAIESLDRVTADATLARLELPADAEQGWGPAITYVTARHALIWGDKLRAVEQVRRDRVQFAEWLGVGSGLRHFLNHAESDLHLALRQGHRARALHAQRATHSLARSARARLALLTGDVDAAARLAAQGVREAADSRSRIDALTTQTAAHVRRGDMLAARNAYDLLTASVASTGARSFMRYLSHEEHRALGRDRTRSELLSPDRPVFPALAEGVKLTRQQRLVLDGMAAGLPIREIGKRQHLSYNTIKTHLRALYTRLGASSRDQAIARAHEEGLL